MSDQDWRDLTSPEQLLVYLQKQGHDPAGRKLRLLAVAFCRRIWDLLPAQQRAAVETAERIVEGAALTEAEWDEFAEIIEDGEGFEAFSPVAVAATFGIYSAFIDLRIHRVIGGCATARAWGEMLAQQPDLIVDEGHFREVLQHGPEALGTQFVQAFKALCEPEFRLQCRLVVEVYGHLFHRVALDPRWLTPAVVALARGIYDERRFGDLPILGDALEEVGVLDPNVLGHCRGEEPHVRGCWVLDLFLGKS